MTTDDYTALQAQIIAHEGLRLRAYRDSKGIWTIGVGRNLIDKGISQPEAMELLDHDLAEVIGSVGAALPWVASQPFNVQRVLYDIAFNAGTEGLLNFHQMLSAIQRGDLAGAAKEVINSKLAPGRAKRLAALLFDPLTVPTKVGDEPQEPTVIPMTEDQ